MEMKMAAKRALMSANLTLKDSQMVDYWALH